MPRLARWLLLSALLTAIPAAAISAAGVPAAAVPAAYPAAPGSQARLISVSGSAEVKVPPDEVLLSVGVESRAAGLDEARRENDKDVAKALAFLRAHGVADKDVQTDYLNIEPQYSYERDLASKLRPQFYIVRKSIGVRLAKVDAFEPVLAGLLANGVQHVHGIEFRTSQLRKHRDAARALAIRAAQDKADALARELGVRRGVVYSASESYSGGWWRGGGWGNLGGQALQNVVQQSGGGGGEGGGEGGALAVGQISVNATVNATFAID
ncbi:SIMPL domain-containing protein [Lysobacter enzymogenes]|uniref:SIMPL domain-containing protein n=1 Tax=Lysobacter enzymogenes TaxID=69 RepID=UPI001AF1C25F|nr:SIMPL domain-containing protein [Lysobacter enzymogenes]QQQ01423.1 SIMPL domain-containing protein [Lysobacter enzymogenes]